MWEITISWSVLVFDEGFSLPSHLCSSWHGRAEATAVTESFVSSMTPRLRHNKLHLLIITQE